MAIDFPSSPTSGQQYQGYTYNSTIGAWQANSAAVAPSTVSANPPANPTVGDMWFNTNDGSQYFYYNDGNTSQWVESRAPITANGYYSPNYIINGAFEINQRGFTSSTSNGFGIDMWAAYGNAGTTTYSNQTFTPGSGPSAEIEVSNYARIATTGQSIASAYAQLTQKIENVRLLASKTVTVSFYARASSGTPKVAIELVQVFGTGGSPSSNVFILPAQVTLSNSWARYSVTISLPSLIGKTIGTSPNTSFTQLNMWVSAGTDFNARTGSLGIQNNTFDFWGIQVEDGSVATTFRRNANSIQGELAACQRYFTTSYPIGFTPGSATYSGTVNGDGIYEVRTGSYLMAQALFHVPMRTAPTVTVYSPGTGAVNNVVRDRIGIQSADSSSINVNDVSNKSAQVYSSSGIEACRIVFHYTASAEL